VKANKPLRAWNGADGTHVHFQGSEVNAGMSADDVDGKDFFSTRIQQQNGEPGPVVPAKTTGLSVELMDSEGLLSTNPVVYPIVLTPDRPPTVRITWPPRRETTVTSIARPNIGMEVEDDFEIGGVWLHYRVSGTAREDSGEQTIQMDLDGDAPKTLKRRFAWELRTINPSLSPGDSVEYWLEARDTNDITGPGKTSSDHYALRVVSDADKRAELMGRLGEFLTQVDQVSENERDLNSRLGSMINALPSK